MRVAHDRHERRALEHVAYVRGRVLLPRWCGREKQHMSRVSFGSPSAHNVAKVEVVKNRDQEHVTVWLWGADGSVEMVSFFAEKGRKIELTLTDETK
jgi:hypothetical protein